MDTRRMGYAEESEGTAQATSCPETHWLSCALAWVRDEEPGLGEGMSGGGTGKQRMG